MASPAATDSTPETLRRRAFIHERVTPNIWRVLILVGIFGLWHIASQAGWINTFLFGSPEGILESFLRTVEDRSIFVDAWATLSATILGFIIGTALGVFLGLYLWFLPTAQRVLDPFLVVFNALPKIALGPMLVIWFGSGLTSKVVLAAFATFVIAVLNAYQGSTKVDPQVVNMVRSMGGTKLQIFNKLVIPAAVPWIIAAFKINIGLALVAVIGGEFVSANAGLGRKSAISGSLFDINGVWVSIFVIMILAWALYSIVAAIERTVVKKYT